MLPQVAPQFLTAQPNSEKDATATRRVPCSVHATGAAVGRRGAAPKLCPRFTLPNAETYRNARIPLQTAKNSGRELHKIRFFVPG